MYATRANIPAGTFQGYMAPMAVPGFFEHGLRVVRTWTADLQNWRRPYQPRQHSHASDLGE